MSYILDALRKSDQQRQQGKAPTLTSASAYLPSPPSADRTDRVSWLPYALIALALAGAGFAIGLLRPWSGTAKPAPAIAATTPAVTHPTPAPAAPPRPNSNRIIPTLLPAAPSPRVIPRSSSTTIASTVAQTETSMTTTTSTTLPAPRPAPPTRPTPPAEPPAITITVHAYASEPSERLAGINGRLLREGQEISPGLRLERITENGIVVNFRGRSFRRSLR